MDMLIKKPIRNTSHLRWTFFGSRILDRTRRSGWRNIPGRWELMHVKDMRKGTPTGLFTGGTDVKNDVAVGTGMLNWPEILKAAKKTGVKYYFIEDESPSVKEQIPVTLKNLSEVKF